MTELTEERLVAFADGELDPEEARAVERVLSEEPEARLRVQRLRASAHLIERAFESPMHEPVPGRLVGTVVGDTANGRSIIDLESARAKRSASPVRRWALPLAASVALAVGLAGGLQLGGGRQAILYGVGQVAHTGVLSVDGPLHAALETAVSGTSVTREDAAGGTVDVTPILTFRDRSGRYCREYRVAVGNGGGTAGAIGLACRRGDGVWHGEAVVAAKVGSGATYRPASGPEAGPVDAAIGDLMAGAPLNRKAEATLIESNWR